MKFKIGDKVIVKFGDGKKKIGEIKEIDYGDLKTPYLVFFDGFNSWCGEDVMQISENDKILVKHDSGKISLDCMHFEEVYKVLQFGAKRYGADNWKNCSVKDRVRYQNAVERHFMEYKLGNLIDDESGLPALAHMACDILFLLHFQLQDQKDGEK